MRINEAVRNMSPPRFTRAQAAELVGRSPDTLTRWRDQGICVPSEKVTFGSLKVDLYTPEDISELKQLARTIRPGRKPSNA